LHFSRARGSIVQAGIFGTFVTTKVQADFNKLFALIPNRFALGTGSKSYKKIKA
jgi:hypothetical protein